MPGVKNTNRLTSYMTTPVLYRVVTSPDGAVTPATPPAVATIDASGSPKALNDLVLFVSPIGTCTLQVWAILNNAWYFVQETALTSARPQVLTVKDLPACKWAVVVTVSSAAVTINEMHSA